jgi:thiol-disulfide isomerase/thioredoxin
MADETAPKKTAWQWLGRLLAALLGLSGIGITISANITITPDPVTPEEPRFGWDQTAAVLHPVEAPALQIVGATPSEGKTALLWEYSRAINGGKHFPTYRQETGDCVSMGAANAVNYLQAVQIAKQGEHSFRPAFQPWIYGVSRTAKDCGNGQLGRSAGSTGGWAAKAVSTYGILAADDQGVPTYSGKVADEWGYRGPPKQFFDAADDFVVRSVAKVTSYEQLRDAITNGYPVTVASDRGFRMEPRVYQGKSWGIPEGEWMHQMCFIGVDDTAPSPDGDTGGAYCLNSWGETAHGTPADDAPPGGFWVSKKTVNYMLKQGDSYAYSNFDGFPPQELDFFVWPRPATEPLAMTAMQPAEQPERSALEQAAGCKVGRARGTIGGLTMLLSSLILLALRYANRHLTATAAAILIALSGSALLAEDAPADFQVFASASSDFDLFAGEQIAQAGARDFDLFSPEPTQQAQAKAAEERILFFTASWCEPCKPIHANLLPALTAKKWSVGNGPENDVQVVDADLHPDLVARYGVTELPTMVFVGKPGTVRKLTRLHTLTPATLRQQWTDFYGW